nr:hypothetical protein [Methylobacterium sp. SD274]
MSSITAGELEDLARTRSRDVEGADLFIALVGHPRQDITLACAVEIARHNADVTAMIEIAAWLGRGGFIVGPARSRIGRAFLDRAMDRSQDYGARSHALKAAMILGQSDRALLLRLQAELIELDVEDDADFLRHATRVTGAVLAQEPGDDLRNALERLLQVGEAEDEASMELGLDALRDGLDASEPEATIHAFERARAWFAKAQETGGNRDDARLYGRCLDTLVAFQSGRTPADLADRIEGIKASAFAYTAYLTSSDRTEETHSWLGLRNQERVHWSLLGHRLASLDLSLSKQAWLNAAAVIQEELLAVYAASRTLIRRSAEGGLEAVLRPRIVGALQRETHSLALLDQWILENASSGLLPTATDLRARVAEAREDAILHRPTPAAVGCSPTAALIELIPEDLRGSALGRVAAAMAYLTDATTATVVGDLFDTVIRDLRRNGDYRRDPDGRTLFDIVVWTTVLFVVMRSNVGVSSLGRTRYLFECDPAKTPLEAELHADYFEFLMGSSLASVCQAEARDIGGGRVDILFSFLRTRTVAEIKRTRQKLTNDGVVRRFGLQKASYDVTNVRYGILMVLDLREIGGGQPVVSERVSVHHLVPRWGTSEHAIVLFRVQGRRVTPSKV